MVVMDTKHKIQKLKAIFEPGKSPTSYDFNFDRRHHGMSNTKAKQLVKVLDKRGQEGQITTDPAKSSKLISFGDLKSKFKLQRNTQQQVKLVRKGGVRHRCKEGLNDPTGEETSEFGAATLPGNITAYFTEAEISSYNCPTTLLKSRSTGELNALQEQNRTPVKSLSQNPLRSLENETVYTVPVSQPIIKNSPETETGTDYVNARRLFNKGHRRDAKENRSQQVGASSAIPVHYKRAVQREKEVFDRRLSKSLPDLAFQEPEIQISNGKGLFKNLNRSPTKPAVPTKSSRSVSEAEDSSKTSAFDSKNTSDDSNTVSSSSSSRPGISALYDDVAVSNFSKLRSKFEQNQLTSESVSNYQMPNQKVKSDADNVKTTNEYQIPYISGKVEEDHEYAQPSFSNEYEVPDSGSSRPSSSDLDDSLNNSFREEKLKKLFGVRDLGKDILDEENNVQLPKKVKKKISDKKKGKLAKTSGSDGPYAVHPLDTTNTQAGGKNSQTGVPPSASMNVRTETSASSADSGHSNTFSEDSVRSNGSSRKPSSGDQRDQFRDSDFIDGDIEIDDPGPRVSDSDFESEEESSKVKAPEPPTFNSNSHKVAYELLTSERTYVDRLYLLSEIFQKRITAENDKHKWFSTDVIKDIFSNIGTIYHFHHQFFLPELEMRLLEWDRKPCIGDILKKISHYLKMYAEYVSNFDTAMSQLNTFKAKVPKFANALNNMVHNEKRCNNLALEHHMLEPVQRIPRYELLLKEYLKKLPDDSQDKEDALKALEVISQAAEHSNNRMKVTEEIVNLFKLNARIDGMDIIHPSRRLLKEGKLDKVTVKNDLQDRYIFLFNDILLCCDKKKAKLSSKTYKIKEKLLIDGMQVFDSINQRFKIEAAGCDLEFQAASEEDKEDWMKVFLGAVKELIRKKDTFKNNPELFEVSYEDQLGKQPPKFIKDEDATMCMLCGTDFERLLKRRHHCRACGAVVCGQCSRHEIQLPYDNNKSNKVCSRCYHKLSKQPVVEDFTRRSFVPNLDDIPHFATSLHLLQKNTWNKFWVAVTQQDLFALKAPKDVRAVLTLPVKLYEVKEISAQDGVMDREFVFKLEHGQTAYFFSAESIRIKSSWMKVLRDGITEDTKHFGSMTL